MNILRTCLLVPVFLATWTTGCATARMALPSGLAAAPALVVSGRQGWKLKEELTFGPFKAQGIRRSWTRGSDLKINAYEASRRKQTFRFALADGGREVLSGEFATRVRRQAFDVGVDIELQNRSTLDGQLTVLGGADSAGWVVQLAEERETPLVGTVSRGTTVIRVTGTSRLQGTRLPMDGPSGYILSLDGRDVAAVEVINDGSVRFAEGIDPGLRPVLAGTAAALLLVEELRATLPE